MSTLPPADEALKKADQKAVKCEPVLVKPPVLKKGATVAIIAPSTPPFEPGDIEFTYKWLTKLGLKYKVGKHVFDRWGDCAGSDQNRLEDFHHAWSDPEVDAILPIRGGNGSVRLLPALDFDLIARSPKIFMGYSDITGLLIPIHQRTGLVTFHGPACSFYKSGYTHHYFQKSLMQTKPVGYVTDPDPKEPWKPEYPSTRLVIAEGKARGRLIGGCMTLIRQLNGTPFEIQTAGRIVFLEDVQEEPHNIDRMLTQLLLAGKLKDAAGIVVGECVKCRPGDSGRNALALSYSLEHVLRDRLGGLGIPVVYGLRFGHGAEQFTLPLGVMAHLDASAQGVRLKIEESATV
jgi:muramoyltetrapeptide carboxypeptidase